MHKVTDQIVEDAINEVVNTNSPLYQKEVEVLSKTQVNLLKAMAQGERQLTSVAVMQQYQIGTPRNVSKNRKVLKNADIIDEEEGKFEFLDPSFELWFRKTFL